MVLPEKHLLKELPELRGDTYISCDYGTQNPTVFLKWRRSAGGAWVCAGSTWSGREGGGRRPTATTPTIWRCSWTV